MRHLPGMSDGCGVAYLCYNLKVLGVDVPGGMQEYWAVPLERLLRIPAGLSDDHAALIEPLAVATHDLNRAAVKPGDKVLVFGGGPIGALIAMVARHRGGDIVVAEINRFRDPLDAPLLPPFPGQRGLATLGSHRLQSRQSPAPARLAAHHPELVADEPPATALFKTGGASSGMRDTSSSSLPKAT
jgi:hypothetical protein